MAYQNVGTPRIYLNIPEYLASTGAIFIDDVLRTLPVVQSELITIPPDISVVTLTNPYIAILGHSATTIWIENAQVQDGGIINASTTYAIPVIPGFSIAKLDGMPSMISFDSGNAGSILLGTFYDFPNSPDLNLSLSYEYGGIKETTTKGGNTLTNTFYTKPPIWGGLGAWELGGVPSYAKQGRRVWDLSFSYIQDSSIFPSVASLTNLESSEYSSSDTNANTLLDMDTFQRVIHLTNGGQLPFIFQPDGDGDTPGSGNNNPDQFAIAKFDMGSFKFDQVANSVYSIKVKIREAW